MASIAQQWLQAQNGIRQALFTDIDNTLVQADSSLPEAAKEVRTISAHARIPLILATGAEISGVLARIQTGAIPIPEIICSSVGTQIWERHHDSTWKEDVTYAQNVASVGFSSAAVSQKAHDFIFTHKAYGIVPQPQGVEAHKVSFHFMADNHQADLLLQEATSYFAPFAVIVCEEINFNRHLKPGTRHQKYCLDILPATKADALDYLIQKHAINGGFKAGDSGNDTDMLLHTDPLLPILVGGHTTEARRAIIDGAKHYKGSLYFLKDGRLAYIEISTKRGAQSILNAMRIMATTADTLASQMPKSLPSDLPTVQQ